MSHARAEAAIRKQLKEAAAAGGPTGIARAPMARVPGTLRG